MSNMSGMNIGDVYHLSDLLKAKAGEIQGLLREIDGRVLNVVWEGPDANAFKHDWWPGHKSQLDRIATDLEGFGQSAWNNAKAQEEVSGH